MCEVLCLVMTPLLSACPGHNLWVHARWSIQSIARVGVARASTSLRMLRIRSIALPTGRPSEMLSAACVLSTAVLILFIRRQQRASSKRGPVIRAVLSGHRKHVKPTFSQAFLFTIQCNHSLATPFACHTAVVTCRRAVVTGAEECSSGDVQDTPLESADVQDTPLQFADGSMHGPKTAQGVQPCHSNRAS